ncbi:MAG TPA: hypothetical protein VG796_19205 [Verrucomicrobiales bacterium]|jgi:hypothetical protein|nr:hypothetical protein [Verrucomicrobiales bacterium]
MRTLFPALLFVVSAAAITWSIMVARECDRRATAAEKQLGRISQLLEGRAFLTPDSDEFKKLDGLVERLFSHIAELKIRVSGITQDLKSKEQPGK